MKTQIRLTIIPNASANTIALHNPSISKNIGSTKIITTWNKHVLKKETRPEIKPLFNDVKKAETKMLNQQNA